ncbi:MAG: 3-deoxy-D-manno-octulosonic acid transferase, partial [Bacteroidota bacterium]
FMQSKFPTSQLISDFEGDSRSMKKIFILDRWGILAKAYGWAHYAYIGGGFNQALHNILEPAVYGTPVFFGWNSNKTKPWEAEELLIRKGGYAVKSVTDFSTKFQQLEADSNLYREVSNNARNFIESNRGATTTIMNKIRLAI